MNMNELNLENRHEEPGNMENPIIDNSLNKEEILRPNPKFSFPSEIFEKQIILPVKYISFDGKYHQGQLVVDKDLEKDVTDFFNFLMEKKFPINKVIPIADKNFDFDDAKSMIENNSSGFNPRNKTEKPEPSNHAFGFAIDINPLQNPYINIKSHIVEPFGALYDVDRPGTITAEIAKFMTDRGWTWGGNWRDIKDPMHFEKKYHNEII
jgi:hypothetical protein